MRCRLRRGGNYRRYITHWNRTTTLVRGECNPVAEILTVECAHPQDIGGSRRAHSYAAYERHGREVTRGNLNGVAGSLAHSIHREVAGVVRTGVVICSPQARIVVPELVPGNHITIGIGRVEMCRDCRGRIFCDGKWSGRH